MTLSTFIGLRAIAWILTDGNQIIQHGIKRVNISYDHYYEFVAGQPVSKRINRRMKKQMRRHLWRRRSRRKNLKNLLNSHGYNCQGEMTRNELLNLRVKGLDEKLTNEQLYMVLMSMQKKRGYKRLRGAANEDKIKSYSEEILKHREKIEARGSADAYMSTLFPNTTIRVEYNEQQLENYRSIAEYLLTLSSSKDLIFNRSSYEKEFNVIMDRQNVDTELRKKLFNIIYHQRPLKKGKIGRCDYEPNRTVTHASNPLYQAFRIWRDVNNIVIYDAAKNELEIPWELRQKWVEKLMKGSNLTKAACCKDLGIKSSKEYTWYSGNVIAGNPVIGEFLEVGVMSSYDHPIPINHAYNVWQDIFSATDDEKLQHLLEIKYHLSNLQVDELINLDFHSLGYADFSTKAIRKLLPRLQMGRKLKEAILDVYGVVDFKNVALRNVVLEQHHHSYKSLVEALQKQYDMTEVKFEIDHLLKLGNKGRKELSRQKRKDEKFLKENAEVLSGRSSYDILKYKLWKESDGCSIYEPGKKIPLKKLFSNEYNIDHAVAKSTLFETGYQNMVLAPTRLNEKKDRMSAADFAASLGLNGEYEAAIEKLPESKKQFLTMKADELPDNWISKRQNSDYNTKCFATISAVEGLATNIPNKLINKFMNEWKLNQYKDDDARYYLCKAFIVANFTQETINYFDNIRLQQNDCYKLFPDLRFPDFTNAPIFLPRVKFTRKTKFGHTPRFALHGESVFGQRTERRRNAKGAWVHTVFYKIRQPLSKLTPSMVENIMDGQIKAIVKELIEQQGSHEKGIESMIVQPPLFNREPIKAISIRTNAEKIFPLHSTNDKGNTAGKNVHDRKIDYVYSDKNHAVYVSINEKGKAERHVTTLMQHIDALNAGMIQQPEGLVLKENDIVELDGHKYYLVGAGEVPLLRDVYTLSATNTRKIKADEWDKLQKVKVNQLGQVLAIEHVCAAEALPL